MIIDFILEKGYRQPHTADLDEMTEYSTPEEEGKRRVIQDTIDICGIPMVADFYYWEIKRKNIDFILPYGVVIDVNEKPENLEEEQRKGSKELTVDVSYFLKNEKCRMKIESIIRSHIDRNQTQTTDEEIK